MQLQFLTSLALIAQSALALPLTESLKSSIGFNKRDPTGSKPSDYEVKEFPGLDKLDAKYRPEMYAGFIASDSSADEDYFFWKFVKNQTTDEANNRLIFWFNGGPGCSSLDGAVTEAGPLGVDDNGDVKYREGTWLETGDLVFVDQPGGVGLSDSNKYDPELKVIADDMLSFIQNYFKVFPEDKKKDLYLSGESYAGQYLPYFGAKILADGSDINLKGLIILNGYIYPDVQDSVMFDFAVENKVVSQSDANRQKSAVKSCEAKIKSNEEAWASVIEEITQNGEYEGENDSGSSDSKTISDECEGLLYSLMRTVSDNGGCVSVYDTRVNGSSEVCQSGVFPPEQSLVDTFLNDEKVQTALNLKSTRQWSECDSGRVGNTLVNQYSYPAYFKLPYIMSKIPVMIAAGENDIICNIKGLEKMVSQLKWGGKTTPGFSDDVKSVDFAVDGHVYGYVKKEGNLMFGGVEQSSHMVPYSQPVGSRALIDVFFGTYEDKNGVYEAPSYSGF